MFDFVAEAAISGPVAERVAAMIRRVSPPDSAWYSDGSVVLEARAGGGFFIHWGERGWGVVIGHTSWRLQVEAYEPTRTGYLGVTLPADGQISDADAEALERLVAEAAEGRQRQGAIDLEAYLRMSGETAVSLAGRLGVGVRLVRRWQAGERPVPQDVRVWLRERTQALEELGWRIPAPVRPGRRAAASHTRRPG